MVKRKYWYTLHDHWGSPSLPLVSPKNANSSHNSGSLLVRLYSKEEMKQKWISNSLLNKIRFTNPMAESNKSAHLLCCSCSHQHLGWLKAWQRKKKLSGLKALKRMQKSQTKRTPDGKVHVHGAFTQTQWIDHFHNWTFTLHPGLCPRRNMQHLTNTTSERFTIFED